MVIISPTTQNHSNGMLQNFWELFSGKKTLHSIVLHFVKEYAYQDSDIMKEFAVQIVGNDIIAKKLDERKLLEIIQMEINKIDFTKIDKVKPTISKDKSKITIFSADKLNGNEFQDFVAKLLESSGFTDVSVTGRTGDQGGDLLAKKDGEQLVIQAKRYSVDRKVTNSAVQEVIGAIPYYNANKGIVITNSFYTQSAKELAKVNKIELWDRSMVTLMLDEYNQAQK